MSRPLTPEEKAKVMGSPAPVAPATVAPSAGPRKLTPEEMARVMGTAPADPRRSSARAGTDFASATVDVDAALVAERVATAQRTQEQHPDITTDDAYALTDESMAGARVAPSKAQAGAGKLAAAVTSGDPQKSYEARVHGGRILPAARLQEVGDAGSVDRYKADVKRGDAMGVMDLAKAVWQGPDAPEPIEAQGAMKTGAIRNLRDKGWTAFGALMATPIVVAQEAVGLFGGDLGWHGGFEDQGRAFGEAWDAVGGYAMDKDVQAVTAPKGLQATITRMGVKAGLFDVISSDQQFVEDATYLPDFDEPAKALYTATGEDKKAAAEVFANLGYGQLPKSMQKDDADLLVLVKQDAREGRITNARILEDIGNNVADSVLLGTIGRTPLADLGMIAPTAAEVTKAYERRAAVMQATGGPEADRIAELFASGLYDIDHEADGKIWLKPSRLQHWLAMVGVVPELFYEADIPIALPLAILGAEFALPLYALAKATGREDYIAMARDLRLPNKVGMEFMAQTGSYDEPLLAMGFKRGSEWSTVRAADSHYFGRIMADVLNPEFQGLQTQGIYRQAGGSVGSGIDKALGTTDVMADFLFDAEGVVIAPIQGAGRRASRMASAARLAPKGLKRAAALSVLRGLDGDATFDAAMKAGIKAEAASGRTVPEDAARHTPNIDEMLRTAGLAPEEVRAALAQFTTERSARTIDDVGQMVNRAGTPEVQALRKSPEYLRVRAEVEAMAAADNGVSASQVPMIMALDEVAAQVAVDAGKFATLEDAFKARQVRAGGTPGAGAYFQRVSTATPTAKDVLIDPNNPQHLVSYEVGKTTPDIHARNVALLYEAGDIPLPASTVKLTKIEKKALALLEGGEKIASVRKALGVSAADFDKMIAPDSPIMRTVNEKAEAAIAHMQGNLAHAVNTLPAGMADAAKVWYEGANKLATTWALRYGTATKTTAAVLAALSPNADWFQNVSMAERLLDIYHTKMDHVWDADMDKVALNATSQSVLPFIKGKALKDVEGSLERATWIMVYDGAHHSKTFRAVNPDGSFGDVVASADGTPYKFSWGYPASTAKAVAILDNPTQATIYNNLGWAHKVRSFYNNIFHPGHAAGDVTIDTHAVAAARWRPLGGESPDVKRNFGGAGSSVTGQDGSYYLYAEAYRRAAKELGLEPRQLQSIAWESARGQLYKKTKPAQDMALASWRAYSNGEITADAARTAIAGQQGPRELPFWLRPDRTVLEAEGASSYAGSLPVRRTPESELRSRTLDGGGGGRGGDSGGVPLTYASESNGVRHGEIERVQENPGILYDRGSDGADAYTGDYGRVRVTDLPSFVRWFWDSVVKTPEGAPLRMYHGSGYGDITTFDLARTDPNALFGPGFYFTDSPDIASSYTAKGAPEVSPAEREAHYRVGKIVQGYGGRERVLDYNPNGKWGTWEVHVQPVDADGAAAGPSRWHATEPDPKNMPDRPGAGVLPVYLSIKNPFSMDPWPEVGGWRMMDADEMGRLLDAVDRVVPGISERARATLPHQATGQSAYETLTLLVHMNGSDNPKAVVNEILKAAGYDGITHIGGGRVNADDPAHRVYIAFSPTQIKSATANVGTFDPANPSILRSESGPKRALITDPEPPTPPDVLPDRLLGDAWADVRGPIGWWMPLDEVEDALSGMAYEHTVLYTGDGRQLARWGPEDTRLASPDIDVAKACVVYPAALDQLAATGDGLYTHNHPSGAPPSIDDLLVAKRADVKELRAVADGDGFTWVVKRPAEGWPDVAEIRRSHNMIETATYAVAKRTMDERIVAAGGNIADGPNATGYSDEVWKRIFADAKSVQWDRFAQATGLILERVPNRGQLGLDAPVRSGDGSAAGTGPETLGGAPDSVEVVRSPGESNPRLSLTHAEASARVPEVAEAARQLAAGKITKAEFAAVVDQYKPVSAYTEIPTPATTEAMTTAVSSEKRGAINAAAALPAGSPVGLRLDIPAYTRHGTWVVTVHEGKASGAGGPAGKLIGYQSTAVISDAKFGFPDKAGFAIAQGGAKAPLATIGGKWVAASPEEAFAKAQAALKDPEWVQVGMDPERHGYFYDRVTMRPVLAAEEVVQVGPLVLAKKPAYGEAADFLYSRDEPFRGEGGKPRTATLFSGIGMVEVGLRGKIDPVFAVEADPAIGAAHRAAHGTPLLIGDVQGADLSQAGDIDYLHASPVCKNSSTVKNIAGDGEQPLDIATAKATADAIRLKKPRVFTLENVKGYQNTEAMRLVEDALRDEGYTFDARVYDAADYGAATHRDRILLRAVKGGDLPPVPAPTHGAPLTGRLPYADWYATVEDIVDALPDETLPPFMLERMAKAGIDPAAPGRPVIVYGGSGFAGQIPYAFAGGPAPTIKATPGEVHRIILPDGRVKRVTPQVLARITGLPDDFVLPANARLAQTVIGNGVPPALSRAVFAPLLDEAPLYSRTGPTVHGSIEQNAAYAGHVIRLFQTGDFDTWLHEFAHRTRFEMGDDWTNDLMRFFDNDGTNLTRIGEEQLAEAVRVVLRGKIHPNGRLRGYLDDIVDYLRNVWLRVRGKPMEVPDGFRAWWDATLDPAQAVRRPSVMVDADRLAPSEFPTVTGPADIDLLREKNPVAALGKKREASRVALEPRRARQELGIKTTDMAADAVDAYAAAYSTVLLGQLRRSWGGEDLVRMGTSVVPRSRAKKVERTVRGKLDAALGGEWKPTAQGFVLTPAQQAGVKTLIDEVAAEPMGEALPVALTRRNANLATISVEDWNALNTALIDIHAGPGAWRDLRAEKAATSGLRAVIGLIDDKLFDTGTTLGDIKASLARAFVVEEMAGPYLQNSGEREALEQVRRRLGDVSDEVRRKVAAIKRNDPDADMTQFYREMAGDIAPRIDPVRAEAVGKMHGAVGNAATVDDLFTAMDAADADFGGLAAVLGASHRGVTPTETSALATLEASRTAVRAGTLPAADLAADPAYLDALGITQAAIKRRFAAMQETADTVLLAFSGGDDSILAGYGAARGGDDARVVRLYTDWFDNPGQWPTAWLELADQGRQMVEKAGGSYNPNAAMLAAIMRLRSKAIVAEYFDGLLSRLPAMDPELVGKRGVAFNQAARMGDRGGGMEGHADRVQHYLDALTTWKTTNLSLTDDAGKQVEFRRALGIDVEGLTDFEAYADAQRIMAGLGWKYGEGTGWKRYVVGDREVFLPDLLVSEIDGVVDRTSKLGSAWSTDWARGGKPGTAASNLDKVLRPIWETLGWTFGMARIGVTTGILIPNPAYFVGNAFGGMLQAYEAMGLQGVLDIGRSAVFLPGERAAMTRGVMARIWNDGVGLNYYRPNTPPIITPSGAVWTADAIADAYTRFGLNTSFAKAEAPRKLLDDIERQPGTRWQRWKRDKWMPARYWQDTLMETATSIDNFYRTAIFIDGLKRGASPEQAAEVARLAAFDYGALTDFEKDRARQVVMFYSYMRRNLDLTIWTMLNHPGRIATQMRGARGLQQMWLEDDSEAYIPEYMDGRFLAYFHDTVDGSLTENAKRGTAIFAPPAPYADTMGMFVDTLNAIDGDPDARREIGARLTPWMQAPIVAMTRQELFTGRDVQQYNSVPGWVVESSRLWDGGIFADNFLQVEPINQMDPALEANPGADRYQARNGVGWWMFRNLTPAGRPMDTLTQMARADFGESVFGEGGVTQAGVDALRAYRESGGVLDIVAEPLSRAILPGDAGPNLREPMDMSPDLDTVRPGLSETEELMALFGIKPIQIDTPEMVQDRAARDISAASKQRATILRKAEPYR